MSEIDKKSRARIDCLYYKVFGICDIQIISGKNPISCENITDCRDYRPLKYEKLEVKTQ